ncbi:MAG: zinc metalloprotease HtpX [Gammaproteobacteria bacterium]|nr:zinc metalloprotease HtpX [Gammaproteobacteria bacterium]
MSEIANYQAEAADWRRQLRINDRRTNVVIITFVAIYVFVGLIVDLYFNAKLDTVPISQALIDLVTFKVTPVATLILGAVALLSIYITFSLYDKIVMLGTEYREITKETAKNLSEQQLVNVIEELRLAAGLKFTPKVFLIEADYMNAFASGYSEKSALVAITRGLLAKLNRSELQAVMAHELSHIRHHDIKLTLVATVLSNLMLIVIDMLFYSSLYGGRRSGGGKRDNNNLYIIIVLLRFLLPLVTMILLFYLSRTREYMADAGAVELTRDNTPLANALLKISGDHSDHQEKYAAEYNSTPHENIRLASYIFDPTQAGISLAQATATMFSTHPPLEERLKALGFSKKSKS